MFQEARRVLPHTVRDGHLIGPHSGVAVDSMESWDQLETHRGRLKLVKEELRQQRQDLSQRRGAVWAVAANKRWYPPRNLEALEIRADAALVDQDLYAFRFETSAGTQVDDGYRVGTSQRKDRRIWSGVIRGERAFMRSVVRPQERLFRSWLDPQKEVLDSWRRYRRRLSRRRPLLGGLATITMALPVFVFALLFKIQSGVLMGIVKIEKSLADKTVDLPIIMKEGALDTREEFSTSAGRRGLLRAVLDEQYLTPERRRVILFLTAILLVVAWALTEVIIRATYPEAIPAKKATDITFGYAIATRLALPAPFEIILGNAFLVLGFLPTVIVAAVGAVVGSWILFIIGTEANKGMKRLFENNAGLSRVLRWMERNARRYGYVVLGVILAIPFSPDTVPLVVFSLLNLQMRWFLLTVFAATTVRVGTYLYLCQIQDRLIGFLCGPA